MQGCWQGSPGFGPLRPPALRPVPSGLPVLLLPFILFFQGSNFFLLRREFVLLSLNHFLLRQDMAVLLLHLVQEHGVDQVVGHRLGPAGLRVVEHEIGIDRGHLFGDEAVLQGAGAAGILGLVMEGHRPELHQAAAGLAHVPDVFLVAPGGSRDAELALAVDHDSTADDVGAGDAGNEGLALVAAAEPDGARFGEGARADISAEIDVVIAREVIIRVAVVAGMLAQGGIAGAMTVGQGVMPTAVLSLPVVLA